MGQQIDPVEQISHAIDKFIARLNLWKYRARTILGRKLIIQTMISLVLWYTFATASLSTNRLQELNFTVQKFLLTRSTTAGKYRKLLSAEWIYQPIENRGIGLQNIIWSQSRDTMRTFQDSTYQISMRSHNPTQNGSNLPIL